MQLILVFVVLLLLLQWWHYIEVNRHSSFASSRNLIPPRQAMNISLGTGGNRVSYTFTVDTGLAVLLATCRTPASMANCGKDLLTQSNYILGPAAAVSD